MQKVYSRTYWENDPSTNTPINEDNLNKMDYALHMIDNRVVSLYGYQDRVAESEANAKVSEENAKTSEINAKASEQLAEQYKNLAFSGTPEGYEQLVEDVALLDIQTSTGKTLIGTSKGGLKINSIDGKNEQISYEGNNLISYPFTDTRTTINGVTFTDNGDGTLAVSGTSTAAIYYQINSRSENVEGQYYLSGQSTLGAGMLYTVVDDVQYKDTGSGVSLPNGYRSIVLYIGSGVTVNGTLKPMLNSGDFAMEFEPYVGGTVSPNTVYPQDIESVLVSGIKTFGKNLVDFGGTFTKAGISSYTFNELTDTFTVSYSGSYARVSANIIRFRGKTITFTCKTIANDNESATTTVQLFITHSDGTKTYPDVNGKSVTIPSDCQSVYLQIYGNNTSTSQTGTLTIVEPMLREVSTDDTYEPYKETSITLSAPITLNGIGDVKDQIIKKDGVWGIFHKFGSSIIDENSNIILATRTDEKYRLYISDFEGIIKPLDVYETPNMLCTHYVPSYAAKTFYDLENGIGVSVTGGIFIYDTVYNASDSVQRFTDFLLDNPITIVYELATPTFEPLPTADQLALNQLATFDTVTNITIDSDIEAGIEVEYGTSKVGGYTLQSLLLAENNAIQVAELTAATLALAQE